MNTQNYNVNLRVGIGIAPKVRMSQGDVGRELAFNIYDGVARFSPPSGAVVKIKGTKPSGLGFNVACALSGNVASVLTTLDMTQEGGAFPVELEISNGNTVIGTANFSFYIEPSPHPAGTTDGTLEVMADIQTQIGDLSNLTTSEKSSLVGAINEATDQQKIQEKVDAWLDEHPEATTTVQDRSITEAKLDARLKLLTNVDLNGVTYFENITLPVVQSYAEAVTYLNGYYYAVCRDYSVTPNTCFVAKYDTSYNLIDTVYTSSTYGIANNIFNDGERIYIDYDSGYHVSFNTSISDDFAVQNTAIRNFAYWNNTLYGITINTNDVTVYTVASDFVTAEEVFTVVTQRYTLQSASIIDGILYIPTTKGLFKFVDMQTQRIIAEIPYYDSKEIENFFKDKDGTVKCCGHFYGLNGVFNIGTFDGGVNGAKMQYTDIDGADGDYRILLGERYGFYKISNGTDMGLPADTGDLLLFNDAKFFVSSTDNIIYVYNGSWRLTGLTYPITKSVTVGANTVYFQLTNYGHLMVRCEAVVVTNATTSVNVDLSEIYTKLRLGDTRNFTFYVTGITAGKNIIHADTEIYMAQVVVEKTKITFYVRNITQNSTSDINAKFTFYEQII